MPTRASGAVQRLANGNRYASTMTYENNNGVYYASIPYFSDPSISVNESPIGDAFNGKTIRQTKHLLANYSN